MVLVVAQVLHKQRQGHDEFEADAYRAERQQNLCSGSSVHPEGLHEIGLTIGFSGIIGDNNISEKAAVLVSQYSNESLRILI